MAKVQFSLKPTSKSRRHLKVMDCAAGDIIYLEESQAFVLIIDQNIEESKIVCFEDGDIDYCDNQTLCRKFVGEINFDVNDFEEFI